MNNCQETHIPLFSVVIPARNEEIELPNCLGAIKDAWEVFKNQDRDRAQINLEIVVVLNRCTDRTETIAREADCIIVYNDEKNLASIRNTGVNASSAPFVITVDADSRMSPNMFVMVNSLLSSGRYVGGGVLILPARYSLGIICTALVLVPIALWYQISAGLFFFTRSAFDEIGGFNTTLPSVEDIAFAKSLRQLGKVKGLRFGNLFRAYIITSTRKFDTLGDWYFLRHPLMTLRLLRAKDSQAADRIWYDFPR